ncbi:hypothetical protein CDAR_277581 [Caerostris darwini]|uniref:Uncharacterized protein n=1 Tax=Caerostris darwini TaxID=1538125 RepID=A0AAV4VTJ6_9ARAC|nr:hypothetical protein CDAR_277581 [Caerostris darwini]
MSALIHRKKHSELYCHHLGGSRSSGGTTTNLCLSKLREKFPSNPLFPPGAFLLRTDRKAFRSILKLGPKKEEKILSSSRSIMLLSDFRALQSESESISCDWQLHNTNSNRRKRSRFLQCRKKIGSEMTAPIVLGAIGYFRSRGLADPLRAQSTLRTKISGD